MRKVIVLIILVAVMGFVAGQLAWIQVNVNGFGDANNSNSDSMAVCHGNLYVGTENDITGTEVWKYDRSMEIRQAHDDFSLTQNFTSTESL